MRDVSRCVLAVACSALLVGCAVGPDYQRPDDVPVPSSYRVAPDVPTVPEPDEAVEPPAAPTGPVPDEAAGVSVAPTVLEPDETHEAPTVLEPGEAEGVSDLAWWSLFGDEVLSALVEEAVRANPDVELAAARIEEAEALERVATSGFWPRLSADIGAGYNRLPLYGEFVNVGREFAFYRVTGVLSWELDLWGRVRRDREASRAEVLASEAARRGVVLSLVARVAETYFGLAAQVALLQIATETAASREAALKLVRQRMVGGASNKVELANAEANLAFAQSAIPRARAQIGILENTLATLLGRPPGAVALGAPLEAQATPPPVPAGLPSDLLERRPDVVEAAEAVHAATARVGSAKSEYLPRIRFDGNLGVGNTDIGDLFSYDAFFGSAVGSLEQPLFEGGAIKGNKEAADARVRQTTAAFRRVALTAFREVSSAAIAVRLTQEELEARESEAAAYAEGLDLMVQRYEVGRSSYLDVLQVDRYLFEARNGVVQTRFDVLRGYVALYLALGGGWPALATTSTKKDASADE
jgi:multidrug efflux system outer membrane protein